MLTLIVVCGSVLLCFKGVAWVARNGWRSMLGLVALRGEAVVEWQDCAPVPSTLSCGCPRGPAVIGCLWCDDTRCLEHLAGHDPQACHGDFAAWSAELADDEAIAKHLRRMERRSR